jgi:predicted acetyltransferase
VKLLKYSEINEEQYIDYIMEWEATGVRIAPAQSAREDNSFTDLQVRWNEYENGTMLDRNMVPATLYFLCDESNHLVGAIDYRHKLNTYLEKFGGNIGYGVKPSERKKGYGKLMLRLLLEELQGRRLDRVLITCFCENIGSVRIIESCGGELENIIDDNGNNKSRYWINL